VAKIEFIIKNKSPSVDYNFRNDFISVLFTLVAGNAGVAGHTSPI
jgi:hypothetical protein